MPWRWPRVRRTLGLDVSNGTGAFVVGPNGIAGRASATLAVDVEGLAVGAGTNDLGRALDWAPVVDNF